jgi:hypothetical protein
MEVEKGSTPPVDVYILDKNRRKIQVGDILKVYHYRAALRRRHCYLYRQVIDCEKWTTDHKKSAYAFRISHLDLRNPDGGYWEILNNAYRTDIEIVAGLSLTPDGQLQNFYERPKINAE